LAIVQVSRITNRKGLQADLPQLAGAELGWSLDTRQLYIGNGTLEEGAPVIGNTEILTEFSDILNIASTYTYKGEAAGYTVQTGPTTGTPVVQTLQAWLDQFATIKDFGAVGDGVTDDTDAINRALYQLYCVETNPQIRRSLFFPGGVYRVTETIKIPTYATLWGEGADSSVIQLDSSAGDSTLNAYVARTADSLQQTGVNIGNNSATAPEFITISNMGFRNLDDTTSVFLVEDAVNCRFQSVNFDGPRNTSDLSSATPDTAGVKFASTGLLICDQIVFDGCRFSGTVYGATNTADAVDQDIAGITICNSKFDTLYSGVVLSGTNTATGVRIISNIFDNIYVEGVVFGNVSLNATGQNIFYDVGNHFLGSGNPFTAIIDIQNDNNISVSDMFERDDTDAATVARIDLNNSVSIATTNGKQLAMGSYTRESGQTSTLINNTGAPTEIFAVDGTSLLAFSVSYTIIRDTAYRTGTLIVASSGADSTGDLTYSDDYVENNQTGIALSVAESTNTVSIKYTSTNTGSNASFYYSITYLA